MNRYMVCYNIANGINNFRSLRKIQYFCGLSSNSAWEEENKGQASKNQRLSCNLDDRRVFPKKLPKNRTKARAKEKEFLNKRRCTSIISFVWRKCYGKR